VATGVSYPRPRRQQQTLGKNLVSMGAMTLRHRWSFTLQRMATRTIVEAHVIQALASTAMKQATYRRRCGNHWWSSLVTTVRGI